MVAAGAGKQGRELIAHEIAVLAHCNNVNALMQRSEWQEPLERVLLAPIRKRLRAARAAKAEQAAATKVEFFTLVRGEN